MFIGHFGIAFLLMWLFPGVNPLVPLVGVSFPDLLWPFLVFARVEKVSIDPHSPLQRNIEFLHYPYSHSLILGTAASAVVGTAIAIWVNPLSGAVFVLASASHWSLDTVVHRKDLPVLGFGRDRAVGFGLWTRPRIAFFAELGFYLILSVAFVPGASLPLALGLGLAFHLLNANSFFGLTKKNPTPTPAAYAALALVGFGAFIAIYAAGSGLL